MTNKISLYGFNNLTKSLSFSLYKLHYLANKEAQLTYKTYINKTYHAEKLTKLLTSLCHAIGGNVLNIAQQNYHPQGASVTLLISEEAQPQSLVSHLDKSHLCIHTYPEEHIEKNIAIFRADIELSTCGVISPLNVLNYVIEEFDADVVDIDYRIRGMTRNLQGKKKYTDQAIQNLSDHLSAEVLLHYQIEETSLIKSNLFHTKLARKKIMLAKNLFKVTQNELSKEEQIIITDKLQHEVLQLFNRK